MELIVWSVLALVALSCMLLLPIVIARVYRYRRQNSLLPATMRLSYIMYTISAEVIFVILLEVAVASALRAAQLLPNTLPSDTELVITALNVVLIGIGLLALTVGVLIDMRTTR